MRFYLAADAEALEQLRDGDTVVLPAFAASSEDEEDEFEALEEAAAAGRVAVVAEVDDFGGDGAQSITLEHVRAFHLDADGSGDLAWYASQELDSVLILLG